MRSPGGLPSGLFARMGTSRMYTENEGKNRLCSSSYTGAYFDFPSVPLSPFQFHLSFSGCGSSWNRLTRSSLYLTSSNQMSFEQAKAFCRGKGASVAEVGGSSEYSSIRSHLGKTTWLEITRKFSERFLSRAIFERKISKWFLRNDNQCMWFYVFQIQNTNMFLFVYLQFHVK